MARAPRLALAGELHYMLQRGHNGQSVFADDADRGTFLTVLREAAAQYGVAIHAYALLDTEVHLLATPGQAESLGRLMQSIGRRYVAAFHRRHGGSGTLWAGRFRSGLIDGQALGIEAVLHLESQPATAGCSADAGDWPWSSAAHHLGRRRDPLLTEHGAYWSLGNTPFERECAYALKLRDGLPRGLADRIDRAVFQGRTVGPAAFSAQAEERTGRSLQARARGRPTRAQAK